MTVIKIAKPYRSAVGIMLLNQKAEVFVGHRIDTKSEAWQMPQGGIDWGESPEQAVFRELWEETGVVQEKVTILRESDDWFHYELPPHLANTLWRGRYRGQRQKWFAMQFNGTDSDINIQTEHPEFNEWKWADPLKLPEMIVPFKRDLYAAIVEDFRPLLLSLAENINTHRS